MTAPRDAARAAAEEMEALASMMRYSVIGNDFEELRLLWSNFALNIATALRAALAGASPPEPSEKAIQAYLAAYDADLREAGAKGVNAHQQYDFLRRWIGAAYAVDFGAPSSAPPTGEEDTT